MPKKKIQKKTATPSRIKKHVKAARVIAESRALPKPDSSRFALYVYWLIIMFFVGSTFYILGRSYSIMNPDNVEISETSAVNVDNMSAEARADFAAEYSKSGKSRLLSGDVGGAILDLNIAIEADPDSPNSFIYRGEAYMQTSDYARAMEDLNMAVNLDPLNPIALYDRAVLSARMENFTAAVVDLNDALNANSMRPNEILPTHDIYAKRAQIMLWNKDFEGAVADYNAALGSTSVPDYLDYAGRAEAWTALGQYQNAAEDYLAAITVISNTIQNAASDESRNDMSRNALAYFEKSGALHVKTGDFASAKTDLEAAHTLAATLGDNDTANRLQLLLNDL
ncbi:MAG: tetratricopeptide repeat protein [Rickettsiales bacterium]|jgi:tetratricopeptide (TPR) repeat protein|nr:tetratricopeptide repeat protein [Rickettsiales bacterium]